MRAPFPSGSSHSTGEHWSPSIFTRGSYEAWTAAPVSEYDRAVEILDGIVATHTPKPLPTGADEKTRRARRCRLLA